MQNDLRPRQGKPAAFGVRPKSGAARPAHTFSQNPQRNHERYLVLARAEAQAGNSVAAENYYQHAEHFFPSNAFRPN
jgi:uncharacterized protein DUF4167